MFDKERYWDRLTDAQREAHMETVLARTGYRYEPETIHKAVWADLVEMAQETAWDDRGGVC